MFENPNKKEKRCLDFIEAVAVKNGFEYSLVPSHRNRDLLCSLYDLCIEAAAGKLEDMDTLKKLCIEIAYASMVSEQQGILHPEPESMEDYQILFGYVGSGLDITDTKYHPVEPRPTELKFTIEADAEYVLNL